jgi:hypothetical protein
MIHVALSKSGAKVTKLREDFAKKNRFFPRKNNRIRFDFDCKLNVNFCFFQTRRVDWRFDFEDLFD